MAIVDFKKHHRVRNSFLIILGLLVGFIVLVRIKNPPNKPLASLKPNEVSSIERDVTYCNPYNNETLKLDAYHPSQPLASQAAIIYVHGGGWQSLSKTKGFEVRQIPALVRAGFTVFSIDYRLAPEYTFPAQFDDVICAIRFVHEKAADYHINPEKLGLYGESAGGQLVTLAGVKAGEIDNQNTGPHTGPPLGRPTQFPLNIKAVANFYGPTDMTQSFIPAVQKSVNADMPSDSLKIAASPIKTINKFDPPFLLIAGAKDTWVPASQLEDFHKALDRAGVPNQYILVKNAFHGFQPRGGAISPSLQDISDTLVNFFISKLGS